MYKRFSYASLTSTENSLVCSVKVWEDDESAEISTCLIRKTLNS